MFITENGEDDDDNDDDNKEKKRPAGHNLRLLWNVEGGRAMLGACRGGRPRKSRREMIRDAAATIRRLAISRPHPKAEEMGCGPCRISVGRGSNDQGRPSSISPCPRTVDSWRARTPMRWQST